MTVRRSVLLALVLLGVVLGAPTGAVAQGIITGAANTVPLVITSAAHGLHAGDQITISGVTGKTIANGSWNVQSILNADQFVIPANGELAASGPYTGGGTWTLDEGALTAFVVTHTADTDDGVCDETDCSLREAVNAANADRGGETITFADPLAGPGYDAANDRYTITLTGGELSATFGRLAITGLGAERLAISGNNESAVFRFTRVAIATVEHLTIRDGRSANGGGIINVSGIVNVSNCHIVGNDGGASGGGILNAPVFKGRGGTLNVVNTLFSANTATVGAGIANDLATANVANSTFSGNSGTFGGGIASSRSTVNVSNSVFSGNLGTDGAAIRTGLFTTTTLRNTILTGSSESLCSTDPDLGTVTGTNNLIDDESCGNDPAFRIGAVTNFDSELRNNGGPTATHALLDGSNAIDAVPPDQCTFLGSDASVLFTSGASIPTDQRNVRRPQKSACDIGAFEYSNRAPTATADTHSTAEDTALTVAASGVLGNDQDPDSDTLTAVLVSGPAHAATFTLNANGSFSYAPAANYNGADSFTYQARDAAGATSNTVTVNLTITAVDDLPAIAVIGGGQCIGENAGRITLALTDFDTPVANLTLGSSTASIVSSVTFGGAGATRTVTITTNKAGSATLTLTVSDGHATATTTVGVQAGSNGNDTLTGTDGADILFGQNGDDRLIGNGGADLLCSGRGNDTMTGGAGPDTFDGGQGANTATDFTPAQGDTKTGGGS